MTDQTTPEPTSQESVIYNALNSGDIFAIFTLQAEAEDFEQFQVDYNNAYLRYQTENEAPEEEREQNTAETVKEQNADAREVIVEVVGPDTTEEA